jgi:RNA polymerase sigma-70 factor (ECF subfamily)
VRQFLIRKLTVVLNRNNSLRSVPSSGLPVAFIGDDEALVAALKTNQPGAQAALYDRYAVHVKRIIVRTLGTNIDIQDHLHTVFIEIFCSINSIKEAAKLKGWITRVTVYTAIAHIRKVSKKRWLVFKNPEDIPEIPSMPANYDNQLAVQQVYEVLDKMNEKERIPFTLRIIDGMSLQDVADACNISLATVKRRLAKAKIRFEKLAKTYPLLTGMIEQ